MKVYCKKSFLIVAGELFTKGKWYKIVFEEDDSYYLRGNRIGPFKGYYIDSQLFYKGYDLLGFSTYFLTKTQSKRKEKLEKLNSYERI